MPQNIELCRQAIQRDLRQSISYNGFSPVEVGDDEIEPNASENGTVSFLEFDEETGEETTHVFEIVLVYKKSEKMQ